MRAPVRNALFGVAAVGFAAVLLACGVGSSPTSVASSHGPSVGGPASASPTAGAVTVAAGQSVDISGLTGDKINVTVGLPAANVSSDNEVETPQKGEFFTVLATVGLTSGPTTYLANPTAFTLVTKDGAVYQATFAVGIEPAFPSTNLNVGQKATGKVVFDVPAGVAVGGGAKVQFSGSFGGTANAYWTV